MKLVVGALPDMPLSWSNGPEEPAASPKGLAEPTRPASDRHEQGLEVFSAMLNTWLSRSGLSHEQMINICSWALNERGLIDTAVLSRVRNRKQTHGASWKHIDALAAANRAIYLWQTGGQSKAWAELGPHGGWGVRDQWLSDAIWLPCPDDKRHPLGFADMAEILAGYLEVPYLSPNVMSPGDAQKLAAGLGVLLDRLIAEHGWGPREGSRRLLEAYPVSDPARQRRFREVIVGDAHLSREDLESELHAIAETIRVVRDLPAGSFGPVELRAELSSDRPLRP